MSIFAQLTDEIGLTFSSRGAHGMTIFPQPRILSRPRATSRPLRDLGEENGVNDVHLLSGAHSHAHATPMLSRRSESVRCEIPKIYGYQLPALAAVYFARNVDILLKYHRARTVFKRAIYIFQRQRLSTAVVVSFYRIFACIHLKSMRGNYFKTQYKRKSL